MFSHLLIGLKVKTKQKHSYLGLKKGAIGKVVEIESNPKFSPNIYVYFNCIKRKIGFMIDEIERVK